MKILNHGVTLIELLVTVALIAVVASLAVPSFRTQFAKRSAVAAAETFVSDMRFARSEALKRNTPVTVCRSSNGTSCSGVGGFWRTGWLVFVDLDGDGVYEPGDSPSEDLLRAQSALQGIASIARPGLTEGHRFTFEATGVSRSANDQLIFTPTGSVPLHTTRLVCISKPGRTSLTKPETTACPGT